MTLSQSLVEEAFIVSEMFNLNELSSLQLLLHGEEQLPQYPGLTRGLVAVVLYYDGRKALVQALKILMSGRPGMITIFIKRRDKFRKETDSTAQA